MAERRPAILRVLDTVNPYTVRFAIFPFVMPHAEVMINRDGCEGKPHRKLAEALWGTIPGMSTLLFANGAIQITHDGAHSKWGITERATEVLRTWLTQETES